jgi:hypothetical protein
MNPNERRYTTAEAANAADLDPETITEWHIRGLVHAGVVDEYSVGEVLRFAAVRSLVGHLVPVYRASEIVREAASSNPENWAEMFWRCKNGESKHLWICVTNRGPEDISYLVYAGREIAAVIETLNRDMVFSWENNPKWKQPTREPKRTAIYDIGPDICRAFALLK